MKPRLYVITNDDDFQVLFEKLTEVCRYDCVAFIQYRRKKIDPSLRFSEAKQIQALCMQSGIGFIVNDDMQLASDLQAFGNCGVHLGQSDGCIEDARTCLGEDAIIGRTCHQSLELAVQAEQAGASYVAFGAYRVSQTKPNTAQLPHGFLEQVSRHINVPVCVIGGVTVSDVATLHTQHVDLVAAVQGVLAGSLEDVALKMQAWQDMFDACDM